MQEIADKTHLIDLHHCEQPSVIGTAVLELDDGVALIDPGPSSTIPSLRAQLHKNGIGLTDIRALVLTHIHLDHAGASGTLVRANPNIRVFVHEKGASHLIDPSRLVASATRLFRDRMDELWGEMAVLPAENITIVEDKSRLTLGDRFLEVRHTPGHASHHIAYLDPKTGIAFTGDATGGRINGGKVVLPATPPPDIDTALMLRSVELILEWEPQTFVVTHYGPATDPRLHAQLHAERLLAWRDRVRSSLDEPGDDDARSQRFAQWVSDDLRKTLGEDEAGAYELGAPPGLSWYGLARYWRKRM